MHGDVVADAEKRAAHGNQEQGAAGYTGSATSADRSKNAQDDRHHGVDADAESVRASHGHDRDGHAGTGHVDGGAQGNGNCIGIAVETQATAKVHVDGDVSRRAAGEERVNGGILQTAPHQRIRVLLEGEESKQGVSDEGNDGHGDKQHRNDVAVLDEDARAVLSNGVVNQADDAERCALDDAANDLQNGVGDVLHELTGRRSCSPKCNTQEDGPHQDAQVVCRGKRQHGIGDAVGEQGLDNRSKVRGSSLLYRGSVREGNSGWHEIAHSHGDNARDERGCDVENDDRAHRLGGFGVRQRRDNKEENQNGSDGFQCSDEQGAQHGDRLHVVGDESRMSQKAQDGTDDQAQDDAQDKR